MGPPHQGEAADRKCYGQSEIDTLQAVGKDELAGGGQANPANQRRSSDQQLMICSPETPDLKRFHHLERLTHALQLFPLAANDPAGLADRKSRFSRYQSRVSFSPC